MTGEEMERAIEFLINSHSNLEAGLAQTNQRVQELAIQLSSFADTQAGIMHVMTRTLEAQAQINEAQARFNESVSEGQARLEGTQARLGAALERLAEAQAHSDRRLDALIDIVRNRLEGTS